MFCSFLSLETNGQDHFKTVLGTVKSGKAVLTANVNQIKTKWSANSSENLEHNRVIDEIEIVNSNSGFYLVARDNRNGTTSAIALVVDNGNLYEAAIGGGGKEVTCSGCESSGPSSAGECEPKITGLFGDWYCTDCSQGTCKKSVTQKSSMGIVSPPGIIKK